MLTLFKPFFHPFIFAYLLFNIFQPDSNTLKIFASHSTQNENALSLQEKIGQMLLVGFEGTEPSDQPVQKIKTDLEKGLVSGVIYFKRNIQNKTQYLALSSFFENARTAYKILFAADLEGGKVNRFRNIEGLHPEQFLAPFDIAQQFQRDSSLGYDYKLIEEYYEDIACKIHDLKINYNFAPVVDIHDTECPIIGKLGRAFSSSSSEITDFARVFIQTMKRNKILSCLKHYPGHGRSKEDSHIGFTNITRFHKEDELLPYQLLTLPSEATVIDSIMLSHVIHEDIDPENPVSLSANHVNNLRQFYNGVIISDDLVMGAILQRNINHKKALIDAIIQSINAGVNLLIISSAPVLREDASEEDTITDIVDFFHSTVNKALTDNLIAIEKIEDSFKKIITMKDQLN